MTLGTPRELIDDIMENIDNGQFVIVNFEDGSYVVLNSRKSAYKLRFSNGDDETMSRSNMEDRVRSWKSRSVTFGGEGESINNVVF